MPRSEIYRVKVINDFFFARYSIVWNAKTLPSHTEIFPSEKIFSLAHPFLSKFIPYSSNCKTVSLSSKTVTGVWGNGALVLKGRKSRTQPNLFAQSLSGCPGANKNSLFSSLESTFLQILAEGMVPLGEAKPEFASLSVLQMTELTESNTSHGNLWEGYPLLQ